MKAYVDDDNQIRLFRPDMNMKRLLNSADRLVMPVSDTMSAANHCLTLLLLKVP